MKPAPTLPAKLYKYLLISILIAAIPLLFVVGSNHLVLLDHSLGPRATLVALTVAAGYACIALSLAVSNKAVFHSFGLCLWFCSLLLGSLPFATLSRLDQTAFEEIMNDGHYLLIKETIDGGLLGCTTVGLHCYEILVPKCLGIERAIVTLEDAEIHIIEEKYSLQRDNGKAYLIATLDGKVRTFDLSKFSAGE